MNWRQEDQGTRREAGQALAAIRTGVATPLAAALIALADPRILKKLDFAVRSHGLERKAAVCA
jgi:hypothetical protein